MATALVAFGVIMTGKIKNFVINQQFGVGLTGREALAGRGATDFGLDLVYSAIRRRPSVAISDPSRSKTSVSLRCACAQKNASVFHVFRPGPTARRALQNFQPGCIALWLP